MTSNTIYIVALGFGFKCPRKIHLNTQCPGQLTLSQPEWQIMPAPLLLCAPSPWIFRPPDSPKFCDF